MATSNSNREFIAGATVVLTVIVSAPQTNAPLDPTTVLLDTLKIGQSAIVPDDVTFKKVTDGQYSLRVPTEGFIAGTYVWRARAIDALLGVALAEDTFVVRDPA